MKLKLLLCALLALLVLLPMFADVPPATTANALSNAVVLIIRHAEKSDVGYGLSPDGEARAQAYTNYFKNFTVAGQPLKLDHIFAAADSKESHRPRLTVEPTAEALGLPVDTRFKNKNFQELAGELQSQPNGHAILIAWHHEKIPALLHALGADPDQLIPQAKWPEAEYGWLIQLRYDQNGKLFEAKRSNEKLMPADLN
jgi:hypothetical protein